MRKQRPHRKSSLESKKLKDIYGNKIASTDKRLNDVLKELHELKKRG
ncbi:MAG: hypothetical protein WCT39_04775 [Candidatus Margulisiibacteriota bacterium]